MQKAILITGTFTREDFKKLMDCVREIEQNHPDEVYQIVGMNPEMADKTIDENLKWMEENFPAAPGQEAFHGKIIKDPHTQN